MRISNSGVVELNGMEFRAYHGCLESERRNGNTFFVDFRAVYDMSEAVLSDYLEDAVDYGRIYDIIAKQMSIPSNLIEHVAARCLEAVLEEFPQLHDSELKVTKMNPPVNGPVRSSSVTVHQK